ncbi:MAG: hypothetical protein MK160_08910 [Rhodobacteraceae bacterium]|nr:hypothetical protein [Paracoccaceae bacterium]
MTTKEAYSAGLFMSDVVTIAPEKVAASAAQALTQLGFTEIRGTARSLCEVEICSAQMSVRLRITLLNAEQEISIVALPAHHCAEPATRFALLLRHLARSLGAEQITWLTSAVRLDAAEFLDTLDQVFAPMVPNSATAAEVEPVPPRRIEFPLPQSKIVPLVKDAQADRTIEVAVRRALTRDADAEELASLRSERDRGGWTQNSLRVASISGALAASALIYQSGAALAGVLSKL